MVVTTVFLYRIVRFDARAINYQRFCLFPTQWEESSCVLDMPTMPARLTSGCHAI